MIKPLVIVGLIGAGIVLGANGHSEPPSVATISNPPMQTVNAPVYDPTMTEPVIVSNPAPIAPATQSKGAQKSTTTTDSTTTSHSAKGGTSTTTKHTVKVTG